jgi:hypothetical protein
MAGPVTGAQEALAIKKCGVGAGGTWGTAVAAGALDGILFLSGQAAFSAPTQLDESRGKAFALDSTPGPITCTGTYKMYLRYAGMELLAAMFMGIAGVPAIQGAGPAYLHTLKWNTDPYGLMITVVKNMIAFIEEIPTAKVIGVTISGEIGPKPLEISFEVTGITREVASAVNTLGTFANVTLPTDADRNPVMFSQTVFRMNAQGGAALAGGDKIYPSKFTLTLKRKMAGQYTGAYRTAGANPQDQVDEVSNDGFPEIKLTMEFPKLTATTYLLGLQNDSRYKLDITCTGALLNGTFYYTHMWQFPHLDLINDQPTDDNGRIKEPLEFNILGCNVAPTGMTGITDPLWWSITSKRTTDPLA